MSVDSNKSAAANPQPGSAPTPAKSPASVSGAPGASGVASSGAAAAAAPTPAPAPAPVSFPYASRLPAPFQATDFAAKGYHLDGTVAPDQVVATAQLLDKEGFALDTITGVDWIADKQFEVVYDFYHPTESLRTVVRCRVPRENPEVPTLSAVYPGANWHEREAHDFFGIKFTGHPNLTPFLLPEDATYHPLRKDFKL